MKNMKKEESVLKRKCSTIVSNDRMNERVKQNMGMQTLLFCPGKEKYRGRGIKAMPKWLA